VSTTILYRKLVQVQIKRAASIDVDKKRQKLLAKHLTVNYVSMLDDYAARTFKEVLQNS
jgi:hypothetical protein